MPSTNTGLSIRSSISITCAGCLARAEGNPLRPRLAQLRILKQGKRNILDGSSVTGDKRGRSACVSGCLVGSEVPSLAFAYRRHRMAVHECDEYSTPSSIVLVWLAHVLLVLVECHLKACWHLEILWQAVRIDKLLPSPYVSR
jgi:hypothetical protein